MTDKAFSINENGRSIRCRMYSGNAAPRRIVIYGHGFAGHKENSAAHRFAEKFISKHADGAVIVFDWPCHGEDALKNLTLSDCDLYLNTVIEYARSHYDCVLFGYATSFGGFLFLKYISDHGSPFVRMALRCPAVDLYAVQPQRIMTPEELERVEKGKEGAAGFDRKVAIDKTYLDEIRAVDLMSRDFTPWMDDVLILHGTRDEIVPMDTVRRFADDQLMEFVPIENADHRFQDPRTMDEAIKAILEFFCE